MKIFCLNFRMNDIKILLLQDMVVGFTYVQIVVTRAFPMVVHSQINH